MAGPSQRINEKRKYKFSRKSFAHPNHSHQNTHRSQSPNQFIFDGSVHCAAAIRLCAAVGNLVLRFFILLMELCRVLDEEKVWLNSYASSTGAFTNAKENTNWLCTLCSYFSRPCDRNLRDAELISCRLRRVEPLCRLPSSALQQLAMCGFYEDLEKGVTRKYTFTSLTIRHFDCNNAVAWTTRIVFESHY